jgi:hypothetical protein
MLELDDLVRAAIGQSLALARRIGLGYFHVVRDR